MLTKRTRFGPDMGLKLVTVHIPGLLQVINWGDSIDWAIPRRGPQNLVDDGTPDVLDLMATPNAMVTKIDPLAHLQWGMAYSLIVTLFTAPSRHQQPLSSVSKSHLQSGLMLYQPVLNLSRHWILDTTQKEINGEARFTAKHQKIR